MNNTIRNELLNHTIDTINDQGLDDFEELHYHAFNEDYYIIGYYQAEQWLKKHDVSAFEAIEAVMEWKNNSFGELHIASKDLNAESIVNLYVYTLGEELLSEFDLDQDKDGLLADLNEALTDTLSLPDSLKQQAV